MKLTLLGTGTPTPDPKRRGPSQVIESGDQLILVDCGAGALHRLVEAGYNRPAIKRIAFTHLHSDHVTGLADVLWAGWVGRWWAEPPVIAGPKGTAQFVERLISAYEYDIGVRMQGDRLSRETLVPRVEEVEEGWTAEGSDWRLSAFRVDHEPVDQAFGFRIDEGASSLVISGDTCASENLVTRSQDVDLLVHEVYWAQGFRQRIEQTTDADMVARFKTIAGYHTPSDAVGKIGAAAAARHLVLSHVILAGGTPEALLGDVSSDYRGDLTFGEDLLTFEIGR